MHLFGFNEEDLVGLTEEEQAIHWLLASQDAIRIFAFGGYPSHYTTHAGKLFVASLTGEGPEPNLEVYVIADVVNCYRETQKLVASGKLKDIAGGVSDERCCPKEELGQTNKERKEIPCTRP